ncbi:MAG: flagellar motor protein MotB [Porcipelethomonas sp.]
MGKKKQEEEGGGSWMDTYGDLVTLLLTFFVMLYSMASVAEDKWSALVKAFNNRFGTQEVDQIVITPDMLSSGQDPLDNTNSGLNLGPEDDNLTNTEMDELFIAIEQFVQENQMQDSILVQLGEDESKESAAMDHDESTVEQISRGDGETSKNIYIQFTNDVLFNPDESTLKKGSTKVINFLGECLQQVNDDIAMVIIKGHTADAPSSVVDSRLLSSERASTISNYLERNYKIDSTKLYPIGLAGDYPIATNENEEGRSKNRRVEIVIIGKNSDLVKSGELLKILGASFKQSAGDIHDIAAN